MVTSYNPATGARNCKGLGNACDLAGEPAATNIFLAAEADILAGGAIVQWPLAALTRFSPQALAGWITATLDRPITAIAMDAYKRVFMALSSWCDEGFATPWRFPRVPLHSGNPFRNYGPGGGGRPAPKLRSTGLRVMMR